MTCPTVALKKDTDSAEILTAFYAFGFKHEDLARVQLLLAAVVPVPQRQAALRHFGDLV